MPFEQTRRNGAVYIRHKHIQYTEFLVKNDEHIQKKNKQNDDMLTQRSQKPNWGNSTEEHDESVHKRR